MAWSVEDVEQKLLSGRIDTIALSPTRITEAVETVETVLGPKWIALSGSAKGLAPTMHIVGTGLRLASLRGVADSEVLIDRIRRNDPGAEAELTAIHLFKSANPAVELELYPPVGSRKADFRLRKDTETWTTVEVTAALLSKEKKRIQAILRRLVDALQNIDEQIVLEVQFQREPTDDEISELSVHLPSFCQCRVRRALNWQTEWDSYS